RGIDVKAAEEGAPRLVAGEPARATHHRVAARAGGRTVGEGHYQLVEDLREGRLVGQGEAHHRGLGGEGLGKVQLGGDDDHAALLGGEARDHVAEAADDALVGERVVEVEQHGDGRPDLAVDDVEHRQGLARLDGGGVEAAVQRPHREAALEPGGQV